MTAFRIISTGGVGFAVAVLLGSYAAIALYTSTPWLWSTVVHESGDRTLLHTILYYEHAARELPLDLVLGMAVGGSALFVFPAPPLRRARRITLLTCGILATVLVILAGTVRTGGLGMLYENLLQFPTRPGAPLVWGGHWRYHLLSHAGLLLLAFGIAGPILVIAGRRDGQRRAFAVLGAVAAIFLALTVFFVPERESFVDPVFLGHQAREAFTHGLVTVPLAWGVCIMLARRQWATMPGGASLAPSFIAGAAGLALVLGLAAASLATSAASQGQSDSLAVLIFPHFFEHTFSYVVATLAAALVFETAARGR